MSVTSLLSGVDQLRGDSSQVDGGLTRVRGELTQLRGDVRGGRPADSRVDGDVTEIRGDISDLSRGVEAFRGAASELRAALRSAASCDQDCATPDLATQQAQAAVDSAGRHAVAAQAGLVNLSGEFSGLQRGLAKP